MRKSFTTRRFRLKSRKLILAALAALTWNTSVDARAQDKKVEITGFVGYTLSEGIEGDGVVIDGTVFNQIHPTSSISYGFTFGYFVTEDVEVGFLFDVQDSTLQIKGPTRTEDVADMKVRNYHGIFTYNFGDDRSAARPFIFGGLGATQYKPGERMGNAIEGNTRFSSTWGGGVKVFPGENVGIQLMARWTPTYIKSDPAGIWCSPYWPFACWPVSNPDYSNQFEFSGGIALRF